MMPPPRATFFGAALATTAFLCAAAAAPPAKPSAAKPAPAPPVQRFPFATGRLTYSIQGPVTHGKRVVTWTDYGRRFRQELSGTAGKGARPIKMDGWVIGDGKYIYTSLQGPGKHVRRSLAQLNGHEMDPTGMPLIAGATDVGKPDGTGTVLKRPCEIRKMGPARFWVWKSLPLKMEMDLGADRRVVMEAIQLDTAYKPSPSLFKVPAGSQIKDAQAPPPQRHGQR